MDSDLLVPKSSKSIFEMYCKVYKLGKKSKEDKT